MTISGWCSYDYHFAKYQGCDECPLYHACKDTIRTKHLDHSLFDRLSHMSQEEVDNEVEGILFRRETDPKHAGSEIWDCGYSGVGFIYDFKEGRWVHGKRDRKE